MLDSNPCLLLRYTRVGQYVSSACCTIVKKCMPSSFESLTFPMNFITRLSTYFIRCHTVKCFLGLFQLLRCLGNLNIEVVHSLSTSVGATNPGSVAQLCPGTRSRLKHQLKSEIEEPRDLKNQHAAQRDQDRARGARYRQEKGLPCRAGEPGKGRGHHQKRAIKAPR